MQSETKERGKDTNALTMNYWMNTWVKYATENYQTILRLHKKLEHNLFLGTGSYNNASISSLIKHPLVPSLVCGSGPSLDDVLPYIKDFPGKIIVGATNARTIAAQGRNPDYICCLDSNKDTWTALDAKGWDWGDAILVTHPCIYPGILKEWIRRGFHVRFFRPIQMNYPFFDDILPKMYPFIDQGFVNAGCTINTQVELATHLGMIPVIIAGVDFGFVDGRSRCAQYQWDGSSWEKLGDPPVQTRSGLRRSRAGCLTTEEMAIYKQNFFLLARTEATTIYSCSRGIIRPDEVDGYVNPADLIPALKAGKLALTDPKDNEARYDKVLSDFGVRIDESEPGIVRVLPLEEQKKVVIVGDKPPEPAGVSKSKREMRLISKNGKEMVAVEKNLDKK